MLSLKAYRVRVAVRKNHFRIPQVKRISRSRQKFNETDVRRAYRHGI